MGLVRLTEDDWGDLLPGTPVTIGKTTLVIQPLGIADLKSSILKLFAAIDKIDGELDPETDEGLVKMLNGIMGHTPEIMELATGLHRDDLGRLPLSAALELFRTVIEVNLASRESMAKNFSALAALFGKTGKVKAIQQVVKEKIAGASQKQSSSSSPTDIAGQK